jgi:hypothetical protein
MRWGPARFRRDRVGPLPPAPRAHAPTPLSVGRAPATPTLCYSTRSAHWWLWWPCPDCGGVRLPLRGSAGGRAPVYVIRAAAAAERCPGCETRRRRSQAAGLEPTVWYDTLLRDWVVRLTGAAILPLELRWFDLPHPVVYRAASDLAYLGDELD